MLLPQNVPFAVKRRGLPIKDYPFSAGGVNPQITYSNAFGEWEAATAANLDMYKWEQGLYPSWFKARVLAWYSASRLVKAHIEDALNAKMRQKRKR
jgi:hypothetical protein